MCEVCTHTFKRRHDQNVHSNNTGNHPKLGTAEMFHLHLQKHENINCSLVNENTQFSNEIE